jgi:hypothetical protein
MLLLVKRRAIYFFLPLSSATEPRGWFAQQNCNYLEEQVPHICRPQLVTVSVCLRQCASCNEQRQKGWAAVSAAMHAWQIFELHERLSEVACFSLLQEILGNVMGKGLRRRF